LRKIPAYDRHLHNCHGYAKSEPMPTELPTDEEPPRRPAVKPVQNAPGEARPLTPAAKRALAEAERRRTERERSAAQAPKEVNGRGGPDPTRYGDWEVNGVASDF
jgi:hypothetical protein